MLQVSKRTETAYTHRYTHRAKEDDTVEEDIFACVINPHALALEAGHEAVAEHQCLHLHSIHADTPTDLLHMNI